MPLRLDVGKALQERVKELVCLYEVSRVIEQFGDDPATVFRRVVDALPGSWQYPESACARIRVRGRSYVTQSFEETVWCQREPIVVGGETVGEVEVCYRASKPPADVGPFLKEERDLIEEVALRLGWYLRHRRARADAEESEGRYRAVLENIPDPILVCVRGDIRYANRAALAMTGAKNLEALAGASIYPFVHVETLEAFRAGETEVLGGATATMRLEGKVVTMTNGVREAELTLVGSMLRKEPALQLIVRDIGHRKDREYAALTETLTRRERQIMKLVADGETNKAIAAYLAIREKTVETHRANMMRKLTARSLADLIRIARRAG